MLYSFFQRLRRTKDPHQDVMETNLKRCLNTFDITLLGIGHMMGSGIYVVSPTTARNIAGPALLISYVIAGVASCLAALAYAEFGVRFPRAGSAYSYSYYSVGEFWAFFVGWNVILENVIGLSAVSRSCSSYIDSLAHHTISTSIYNSTGGLPTPFFSSYPDFLALGILLIFVIYMSFGVHATSVLNNVLCLLNMAVMVVIIGVGAYFADSHNWTNKKTGGFMPFGVEGVLQGSATCFFAYIGFDAIAASGEEAKTPQRSLPIATLISMSIVTVLYCAVAAVLTLMVNYTTIQVGSGLPDALEAVGAVWAKYVVIVGALAGMSTVLIGTLFALTRIAYAMADDGLLMAIFGKVVKKTQIPLFAMYVFSALAGLLAVILEIDTLVEMMSIGTLFAYLVVSAGVIIFRYKDYEDNKQEVVYELKPPSDQPPSSVPVSNLKPTFRFLEPFFSAMKTETLIALCIAIITGCTYVLGFFGQNAAVKGFIAKPWAIFIIVLFVVIALAAFFVICIHEQHLQDQKYKMPFVPVLPVLSIVVNAFLMTTLEGLTWVRLLVWIVIGYIGYFAYGIWHSKAKMPTGPTSPIMSSEQPTGFGTIYSNNTTNTNREAQGWSSSQF